MAEFSATVYQNEFLPDGGTDVNAIVTVTCSGAGVAGQTGAGDAGENILVDTSGSMGRMKLEAATSASSRPLKRGKFRLSFSTFLGPPLPRSMRSRELPTISGMQNISW